MSLVTLFSAGTFNGVITNTPSGTAYRVTPNQIITGDSRDLALLTTYGLIAFPPTTSALSTPTLLTASSGNYTVPGGVTFLNGVMSGGGAGGGGVAAAAATAAPGTPGVLVHFSLVVTPGQVIPFVCGAGGNGGAAGNNVGIAGGDTTFGSFTAKGGIGGNGSASGNAQGIGAAAGSLLSNISASGGIPTVNGYVVNVNAIGSPAGAGGGVGGTGAGLWGTPGAGGNNAAGNDATGYGAPGGGAGSTASSFAGGKGSPGAILLH